MLTISLFNFLMKGYRKQIARQHSSRSNSIYKHTRFWPPWCHIRRPAEVFDPIKKNYSSP